jgi:hypothetical protein
MASILINRGELHNLYEIINEDTHHRLYAQIGNVCFTLGLNGKSLHFTMRSTPPRSDLEALFKRFLSCGFSGHKVMSETVPATYFLFHPNGQGACDLLEDILKDPIFGEWLSFTLKQTFPTDTIERIIPYEVNSTRQP